jgi:hypothetical protein
MPRKKDEERARPRRTVETRTLWVSLTDEEVDARARQFATAHHDLRAAEADLVKWKEDMKAAAKARESEVERQKGEVDLLAETVRLRRVRTQVECDWQYRLGEGDGGVKYLIRRDTGEAVERRPLTVEERQLVIGERLDEASPEQIDLWEAQIAASTAIEVEGERQAAEEEIGGFVPSEGYGPNGEEPTATA